MRVILIDDEKLALEVLHRQLLELGDVTVVGKYTRIKEALEALETDNPDAVFLDIEMGSEFGLNATHLFQSPSKRRPIIFVTAYAKYAVEAFEINALDYLLKPVTKARLEDSIKRIKVQMTETDLRTQLKVYCLGQFRTEDLNGNEIKWRTKKVKELFAYLVHHRKAPINRSVILNDLWLDSKHSQSSALLNTTLYQLRKTLKILDIEAPIHHQNDAYCLNFPVEIDLEALETDMRSMQLHKRLLENNISYIGAEGYTWAMPYNEFLKSQIAHYKRGFIEIQIENHAVTPENDLMVTAMMSVDPYDHLAAITALNYHALSGSLKRVSDFFGELTRQYQDELEEPINSDLEKCYELTVKRIR